MHHPGWRQSVSTTLLVHQFSLAFTAICFGLGLWYGIASTGTLSGVLEILWIILILSILEVSLSFDNAVVNASILKEMDEKWQQRFLVWGIAIAVFGRGTARRATHADRRQQRVP